MSKSLSLMLLLLIGFLYSSAYAGQATKDLTLQVEGRAPIVKNDVVFAREEAVRNALENAIMQAVAKVLLDKGKGEEFQAVKSVMIGKADRYIRNYRIISQNRQHDEYTVAVHVDVAIVPVMDDLLQMGVLQDQGEKEGVSVSLSLRGMKKYSDFAHLKTFLQDRPEIVRSAYPCSLEWQRADFDLIIIEPVQSFVAEFEKTGRYSLESLKKNKNVVEVHLQVKEEAR